MAKGKVRIVVDSSTCLELEQAEALGITVVPLHVVLQGRSYRDMVDLRPTDFYRTLRQENVHATTSAPSVGEYVEAYRAAAADVVCLTISAKLSSMHQAATAAERILCEDEMVHRPSPRIRVIDSGTAAGGLRLLALAAAAAAAAGADLEEVTRVVESVKPRVEMYGALETVEYLARSGRVPEVVAAVNSVLHVKPVLRLSEGSGILLQLARTSQGVQRALLHVLNRRLRRKVSDQGRELVCTVFHADALAAAEVLMDNIGQRYPAADVELSEFTPVLGSHSGPGTIGLAFYIKPGQDPASPSGSSRR